MIVKYAEFLQFGDRLAVYKAFGFSGYELNPKIEKALLWEKKLWEVSNRVRSLSMIANYHDRQLYRAKIFVSYRLVKILVLANMNSDQDDKTLQSPVTTKF